MDGLYDIVLVVITGLMSISACILTQVMVNNQKRSDFLKEKSWDQLKLLVDSLSKTGLYINLELHKQDKNIINFSIINDTFSVMQESQSHIYMTGRKDLIKAYLQLYEVLYYIDCHSTNDVFYIPVMEKYKQIPKLSINLIRKISTFIGS